MSDRLSELARQRALVSEHLAWLDREIAEETLKRLAPAKTVASSPALPPSAAPSLASSPAADAPASVSDPTPAPASPAVEPDQLLEQYRVEPSTVKNDVRKGCLLYFVGAFVVLGIVIAILYFTIGSR